MRKPALRVVAGLLVIPVVAWFLAWLGAFSFEARATPPAWERALAGMAFDASVAGGRRASPIRFA